MMKTFHVGPLDDWAEIGLGEEIEFSANRPRKVKLEVNATGPVEAFAMSADGVPVLLGASEGHFELRWTIEAPCPFVVKADDESTRVFIRGSAADQRVEKREVPVFTSVTPRVRRNTEFDRMMQMMRLNEMQRATQYQAMETRLKEMESAAADAPPLVETEPAPVSAPAPKQPPAEGANDEA